MHPAFSVIFFTVASGAGFGLFSLLFIADVFKLGGGFNREQLIIGGLMAMGLVVFGLLSSTFHLANPKNAWRAVKPLPHLVVVARGRVCRRFHAAGAGLSGQHLV